MINAGTRTTSKNYATVEGTGGPRENEVTLDDLGRFLAAAKAQGIPGDTPIEVPSLLSFFGSALPCTVVTVVADVVEDTGATPEGARD